MKTTTRQEDTVTFNQQSLSLFPKRHNHNGCMRPLIRSSIRLEQKRRGK